MRILMCGDRNWTDVVTIDIALLSWQCKAAVEGGGPLVVIEGEARGADRIARERALYHGIEVERYPADWDKYKKAAGPIRNQQMLDEGRPDIVYAFHDDLENSRGTKDMVTRAKRAGVPVVVVSSFAGPAARTGP